MLRTIFFLNLFFISHLLGGIERCQDDFLALQLNKGAKMSFKKELTIGANKTSSVVYEFIEQREDYEFWVECKIVHVRSPETRVIAPSTIFTVTKAASFKPEGAFFHGDGYWLVLNPTRGSSVGGATHLDHLYDWQKRNIILLKSESGLELAVLCSAQKDDGRPLTYGTRRQRSPTVEEASRIIDMNCAPESPAEALGKN